MALPKIDLPLSEIILPSNGEKVKIRPFTVKEEKILLVAAEGDEAVNELIAIKQVINNCLVDKTIEDLSMLDIEYVYLKLRTRSVDNMAKFTITDPDTQEKVELELDMDSIEVKHYEGHTNEVKVNDEYTLFLKHPTVEQYELLLN